MNEKARQGACYPEEARSQADEIAVATADAIRIKYMAGYREHGGDFRHMPLGQAVAEARDEVLDLCAFIHQICRQHEAVVTMLDRAADEPDALYVRALVDDARDALAGVRPGRMGKDRDMAPHAPDTAGRPDASAVDRDFGDETLQDDSPAADAQFRALAAEPDTDLINRLAALERRVARIEDWRWRTFGSPASGEPVKPETRSIMSRQALP